MIRATAAVHPCAESDVIAIEILHMALRDAGMTFTSSELEQSRDADLKLGVERVPAPALDRVELSYPIRRESRTPGCPVAASQGPACPSRFLAFTARCTADSLR